MFLCYSPHKDSVSVCRFVRCLWLMSLAVMITSSQTDKQGRDAQKVLLHTNVAGHVWSAKCPLYLMDLCVVLVSTLSKASAGLFWRQTRTRLRLYFAAVTGRSQVMLCQKAKGLGKLFYLQSLESLLLFYYSVCNTPYNPHYLQTSFENNSLGITFPLTLVGEQNEPAKLYYCTAINEIWMLGEQTVEHCCTWWANWIH